ncbi:MAG TPA: 30S ribosomal protein S1 [Chthonomonadaceae bacterium]|nr:30S ribosomal protein S1 [Chthonomonadaceae bacterium]
MSDEMVQEKQETATVSKPDDGRAENPTGAPTAAGPLSSETGAPPTVTDTAAPAPPEPPSSPVAYAQQAGEAPAPAEPEVPGAPLASTHAPEPTPAAASVASSAGTDTGEFERAMQALDMNHQYDESLRQLHEGDVITGTVMRVDREGVLVDVGAKSEGIIRLNELSREPNVNPNDVVKVGERIKVFVLEPANQEGNPVLSKKRADFEQAWERVQHAKETGETLVAMVTDRVKGGLVVDLGIRGFVPASHVGTGSLKNNLEKYVGQSIPLKVIEVDKDRRKVVLSNKLAVQEEREARSAETKSSLAVGQVRRGVVRRLTNYGAFVDLGGIDGLLHISEMSWTRINDPKEVLREGQEIDVQVLKLDLDNNRVSLGLRQILPDPWIAVAQRYHVGDVITGTVTRLVPFGAFVQVEGGVEGIIPNSEMPRGRGGKGPAVSTNEEVTVKVIDLRPEERKMTLSLRALQPEEPAAPREGGGGGRRERERPEREDYARYAPGRGEEPRFTIGDALAAQRRERERRRERRPSPEEEYEDLEDISFEEPTEEPIGEETEPGSEA